MTSQRCWDLLFEVEKRLENQRKPKIFFSNNWKSKEKWFFDFLKWKTVLFWFKLFLKPKESFLAKNGNMNEDEDNRHFESFFGCSLYPTWLWVMF